MSTLGERIQKARKNAGLKQLELGHLLKESAATISNWERDLNKPDAEKLIRLCQVLNVPPADLLNCHVGADVQDLSLEEAKLVTTFRRLDPVAKKVVWAVVDVEAERESKRMPESKIINIYPLSVSAGRGIDLVENFPEPILVPKTPLSERADFVLRVAGDSMEPEYSDGDLILVRQTPALDPGSLGVFGLNGEGYFKRLGETALISMNPAYNPIPLNESLITFGEVLGKTEAI